MKFSRYHEIYEKILINELNSQDIKDALARLGECFVRMQVEQITADDSDFDGSEFRKHIYNPNEMNEPDMNLMNLFKPLADVVIEKMQQGDPLSLPEMQQKGQEIRDRNRNVFHKVKPLSHDRFQQILQHKSQRYDSTLNKRKASMIRFKEVENVINAVCHPKTVDSACELYLQQIRNELNKQNSTVIQ